MIESPPRTFDEWLAARIQEILWKVDALMTQGQQLGADVAALKTNVAAEIQQVIDALAKAAANTTELADLKAAVTQAHTDLSTLNANLKADDPAAPPPPPAP